MGTRNVDVRVAAHKQKGNTARQGTSNGSVLVSALALRGHTSIFFALAASGAALPNPPFPLLYTMSEQMEA